MADDYVSLSPLVSAGMAERAYIAASYIHKALTEMDALALRVLENEEDIYQTTLPDLRMEHPDGNMDKWEVKQVGTITLAKKLAGMLRSAEQNLHQGQENCMMVDPEIIKKFAQSLTVDLNRAERNYNLALEKLPELDHNHENYVGNPHLGNPGHPIPQLRSLRDMIERHL